MWYMRKERKEESKASARLDSAREKEEDDER